MLNYLDCNGNIILLGMFLQNITCEFLVYQVRIRNNKLVLHSGGCYVTLTQVKCENLKIIPSDNINFLGFGESFFHNQLIF